MRPSWLGDISSLGRNTPAKIDYFNVKIAVCGRVAGGFVAYVAKKRFLS
jgi:hypothetical protein